MELSRCTCTHVSSSNCRHMVGAFLLTYVERRKLSAVCVEGLVVVLGELLCSGAVSMSHAVDYRGRIHAYGRSLGSLPWLRLVICVDEEEVYSRERVGERVVLWLWWWMD